MPQPTTTVITPEEQLYNLAATVLQLTAEHPNGRGYRQHVGTKRQIAATARQLAEAVDAYMAGRLEPKRVDERIPF